MSGSLDEVRFWKAKRTAKDIGNYFDFPVNGATDTEGINSVLGLYYKFNEGTVSNTTQNIALNRFASAQRDERPREALG